MAEEPTILVSDPANQRKPWGRWLVWILVGILVLGLISLPFITVYKISKANK